MNTSATVLRITKSAGIAGQVSYSATVQYEGEAPSSVTFVGSVYGGPVVMVTESQADLMHDKSRHEVFVTDPERFGTFGESWVRRFFAEGE